MKISENEILNQVQKDKGVGCKGKTCKTYFIFLELKKRTTTAVLEQTNPST